MNEAQPQVLSSARAPYTLYGRLIGPLLAGYLLLNRGFAALHIPGTPIYIGEIVLAVGCLGALAALRCAAVPVSIDPILSLLAAFGLWGLVQTVSDLGIYGIDDLRDSALWYYSLFAFLTYWAITQSPQLLNRLISGLKRITPYLLIWLPFVVYLNSQHSASQTKLLGTIPIFAHKTGDEAIAALTVLAGMWLLPDGRSARSRALWSVMTLGLVGLSATQNRGGLIAVTAGSLIGLTFFDFSERLRLMGKGLLVATVGLAALLVFAPAKGAVGAQGRGFSADQLVTNILSLDGGQAKGNLDGTIEGRQELWTRVLNQEVSTGRLIEGAGFGLNLAAEVKVFDAGKDTLRNPHNSHLDVLARMGLIGLSLWFALWSVWYCQLVAACRKVGRRPYSIHRQVAVWCLAEATAILVSAFFDPALEAPMIAILLWVTFGLGIWARKQLVREQPL